MDVRPRPWSVVITAHQFNPTVFRPIWIKKVLQISDDDIQLGSTFSHAICNCQTDRFHLLVVENRLQFTVPFSNEGGTGELIREKVGAIVGELPHTPYRGLGLNFDWEFRPEGQPTATVTRRLFFSENNWLCREFNYPDASFGGYFSKNLMGLRLKLDAKPLTETTLNTITGQTQTTEFLLFNFNCHLDLQFDLPDEEKVNQLRASLIQWEAMKEESSRIIQAALRELDQ